MIFSEFMLSQRFTLNCAGDIAAFTSHHMVQGLGLTTSELMLARTSAVRYSGKMQKPARLLDLMTRFGVDFLTFRPLSRDNILGLRTSSLQHWGVILKSMPEADSDEFEVESSSDESEIRVCWDAVVETNDDMPGPSHRERREAVTKHVQNMVFRYVSKVIEVTEEPQQVATERRASGSSGVHRRKRAVPRRIVVPASTISQASSSTSSRREPPVATVDQVQQQPEVNPRDNLLALEGIVATRIPGEVSLNRLEQFLEANQPCSAQEHVSL